MTSAQSSPRERSATTRLPHRVAHRRAHALSAARVLAAGLVLIAQGGVTLLLAASLPDRAITGRHTPGYKPTDPEQVTGYFPPHTALEVLGEPWDGMLHVRFTTRRGRVIEALCRREDVTVEGGDAPSVEALNEVFGLPLWQDDRLWDDEAEDVAQRLGWPRESRTATLSSYRSYQQPDRPVLGTRPFSLALYGERGKTCELSMIFANKGDIAEYLKEVVDPGDDINARTFRDTFEAFQDALEKDRNGIEQRLTTLLGEPVRDRFGQGRELREKVWRWDWKDHAILLATPRDEYVGVRIISGESADQRGRRDELKDEELKALLAQRVQKRPNGDVIVSEIPMVNQGPKGYCVPATWERYLRYVGIAADMYALAMAGETSAGGGTYIEEMVSNVNDLLQSNGRRLEWIDKSISLKRVRKYVDRGLPLMWGMRVNPALNLELTHRAEQRQHVEDWRVWKKQLEPVTERFEEIDALPGSGHICMIIGYNPDTDELAISDSWGEAFAERWITLAEAQAISMDEMFVIRW